MVHHYLEAHLTFEKLIKRIAYYQAQVPSNTSIERLIQRLNTTPFPYHRQSNENEKELLKKIKLLKTKNKKTIIMVTHNFNSLKICDEIIVISGGAIKDKLNYKKFFSKYILI